ncbi:glycosyltransferase family 2 protein [bacterium]|nr:glycosyltransferase family 2 protein [bacterium]
MDEFKPSVYIAVLNQGEVAVDLANNLLVMVSHADVSFKITWPNHKPTSNNRNKIVKAFLETDYHYLLMIDDDVVPPPNLLDLIKLGKDIVAAPCPQWHENDIYWVVMDYVPEEEGYRQVGVDRRSGLEEVDAVGTGCILIKRKVLENIKAPFERKWDEDGIQALGHDFYFCQKAKEKGFEVYAHFDYPCRHYKRLDLIKVIEFGVNASST